MLAAQAEDVNRPAVNRGERGLPALVERLSAARSMDELIATVTHAVRSLLGADGATFVWREGDHCHYAEEDAISPLWKGRRFPLKACISGWCILHGQPTAIPDIYRDPRIPADAYRPTFVRSLAMAPVRAEHPIAALGAYWSQVREIAPEEVALLQAIAASAALAVAYVRLQGGAGPVKPGTPPRARPATQPQSPPAGGAAENVLARLHRRGLRSGSVEAYAFAALCVAAATGARFAVGLFGVAGLAPFSPYYVAVLAAVLAGGARAGAAAILLSAALADWAFLAPRFQPATFDLAKALNLGLFVTASGLMIWLLERSRLALGRMAQEDSRRVNVARELEHRTRNALTMVQTIVQQSLRDDRDTARLINERVMASLGQFDLLGERQGGAASVRTLLAGELAAFDLGRFDLTGEEDAPLAADQRTTLALAVHELATNALKHGALSGDQGRVTIGWWVESGRRTIHWVETGGPPVERPSRRGYGSVFLRRLFGGAGGSIVTDYRPTGLVADLTLPLA